MQARALPLRQQRGRDEPRRRIGREGALTAESGFASNQKCADDRRRARDDPTGRVACETLVNTGLVVVSGEISTTTYVDIQDVARDTIRRIGYTNAEFGFDYHTCAVNQRHRQAVARHRAPPPTWPRQRKALVCRPAPSWPASAVGACRCAHWGSLLATLTWRGWRGLVGRCWWSLIGVEW
jgi:S-adenosylmethionine synthetase family protein